VLKAFLQDRESETYQFVVRAVRDDATRSINSLSKNLVDMTDRIIDDDRRHLELMASYVALQESHQALMDHHAGEMLEYARLMGQLEKLKRFVPTRLLRYFRLIN
jgi:hypothetical protein